MSDDGWERSTAWQLGWLAVSGPAVIVVSVVLYVLLHAAFMGYAVVFLQLWVLAAVVFGICAVVTGTRDRKRHRRDATRGAVIGVVGAALSAVELVGFGSLVALLSQVS
jgi:Na+-transporting methylmalonyl-CoA/oxaloacetate decarboxylase gamma subunit